MGVAVIDTVYIGQRVLYGNHEIVTIIETPKGREAGFWSYQWVKRANGIEQAVSKNNLSPLPNGEL
jgi:hypothetical protein